MLRARVRLASRATPRHNCNECFSRKKRRDAKRCGNFERPKGKQEMTVIVCSESVQGTTFKCTRTDRSVSNLMKMFPSLAFVTAFSAILAGGCSKSVSSSMLGDAAHPTPVHVYTVAEETAQRRVQAAGSLFALEESILSAQVEGRVSASSRRCWRHRQRRPAAHPDRSARAAI